MADIHGRAFWPGAESCAAFTYTVSQGISPGVAVLTINPQARPVDPAGNVVVEDGRGRLVIPRCKLDKMVARRGSDGEVWDLVILDRRWRWRELGTISGNYNVVDPFGKVLPWTARTPTQLAELCLRAMGEARYRIDLPPEAPSSPPVQWDHVPPAQALASLAESMGCVVVYRLDEDSVLVTRKGDGAALPLGSIQSDGPTLDGPERPDRLVIVGQPIRYQARFLLEAVGEDWDGSIRPIAELSYAPAVPAAPVAGIYTLTPSAVTVGNTFTVTLTDAAGSQVYTYTAAAATVADVTAGLTALVNGGAAGGLPWTAIDLSTALTITGSADGSPFHVAASAAVGAGSGSPRLAEVCLTLAVQPGLAPWAYATPPGFAAAQATDRLTKREAVEKAKGCIYRMFRVRCVDPSDAAKPLRVGDYLGRLERREQIVLQQTRAEQITPQPQDERILDDQGRPRIKVFYDGHTRDLPARVIGSYSHGYSGGGVNTREGSDVAIPFTIDAERGLVIFSQYVTYSPVFGRIQQPTLVLECACNLRDFATNALVTYEFGADLGPPFFGTPPLYVRRDDVQYTVIGDYDAKHRLIGAHELRPAAPPVGLAAFGAAVGALVAPTAQTKATYYLSAYAKQFRDVLVQERVYNGLEPIYLDGAIAQVTWSLGPQGVETHASRNTEHSPYVPPYPTRRRNEILDPLAKGKRGAAPPLGDAQTRLFEPPASQDSRGYQ